MVFLIWLLTPALLAIEVCEVCKKEIRSDTIITMTDEVTRTKHYLCTDCPKLPNRCYLCSLPVLKDFTSLPDGRVICQRDVKAVIIDDKQAIQICEQVKEELDRQFIRFTSFPTTNVTIHLIDRVNLQEIYKVIGSDFTCPNTRGYTRPKTNDSKRSFEIGILSGIQKEELMTVCVHEYAHTWIFENVPPAREKTIGGDAVEGFCELLAYLYAEQHGLVAGKSNILANFYTRGQVHLFIRAEQMFGFNEIVEWMKYGDSPLLLTNDLQRVRQLDFAAATGPRSNGLHKADSPVASNTNLPTAFTNLPIAYPETLTLKSISGPPTRQLVIINDRTLGKNDQATMRLTDTNVLIRCLEIRTNSVLIQIEATGEKQELFLRGNQAGQSLWIQPLPGT